MKRIVPFILLVLLAIPSQGYSALVNYGAYSYDSATGLNWLHLTETSGLSLSTVETMINPGGSLYGWRFATGSEFETMATALCTDPSLCSSSDFEGWSSDTNGVVAKILSQFGDIGFSHQVGDLTAWGIIADHPQYAGPGVRYSTYLFDTPGYTYLGNNTAVQDYIDTYRDWVSQTSAGDDRVGSFLVSANVPIPGAIWLLGSGIIGLVGLRRKLKK